MNKYKILAIVMIFAFTIWVRFTAWAVMDLNDLIIFLAMIVNSILAGGILLWWSILWNHKTSSKNKHNVKSQPIERNIKYDAQHRPTRNPKSFPRHPRK